MKELSEIFNEMSPEQQREVLKEENRLLQKYSSLRRMRKAMDISQTEVARRIGTTSENVRQTEIRNDIMLSTLNRYIEAIGGELKLSVVLPGLGEIVVTPTRESQR